MTASAAPPRLLPAPDPRLLYIHPHNHLLDWAVPIGGVGAANLLPRPPVGRFASEVSRADVERAEVVLLGVHWFFPLGVLEAMVAALRAINPRARIVVGGITAAFYRETFARRFAVDFVCSGDVEASFPILCAHLLAGEEPPPLPNVWTAAGGSDGPRLGQREFGALDWLRIDWFPAYRRRVEEQHAAYRPGEIRDGIFPTLPVTRGCVRTCAFCFGSYQRQVFGPRVLLRPAARLRDDLERIAADRALRFVTIMFADACYLPRYADALAGRRYPLDAFLMFCGTAPAAALDAVRSGFAGEVFLLNIPPGELSPLRRDGAPATRDAAFAAMVAHFSAMARTRALVFYVGRAGPDPATAALPPSDNTQLVSGQDWSIARPNALELGTDLTLSQQLDGLVEVGKQTAALHLLRALVPPLRRTLDPELDTATFLSDDLTAGCDPFERQVHRLLLAEVRARGVVGYEALSLRWLGLPSAPGLSALWAPPGRDLGGDCAWTATLGGLAWRGRVEVPADRALWIAPCPRVGGGGETVDLAGWVRAQLPSLPVARGPARTVEVGGEARGATLDLWIEDGGERRGFTLPLPPATPDFALSPWPRLAVATALLRFLADNATLRGLGWAARGYQLSRCQLTLQLAATGRTASLCLFPRAPHHRFAGTATTACVVFDVERDESIEHLQSVIARLIGAVEAACR